MVYLGKNRRQHFSKKQAKALKKHAAISVDQTPKIEGDDIYKLLKKQKVEIPKIITVRKFSETLNIPVTVIIKKLMQNGVMANINESIDFDTASIVADEFNYEITPEQDIENKIENEHKNLETRPPIVVVLGHVDHGKTTLLDAIRKTDIVSSESGGITQHIGAYQVIWKDKKDKKRPITFLDTPGHEAFSAMRAHGANITDIAILVVAADDGVKPQTKEAISHIKAANIPVIVAINKIDKPGADIERVKRELADLSLNPEEWGGETIMVPVSAKKGEGIANLLDMVLLTSDMKELKAEYASLAEGVVIESHMQAGLGPVATVLIQHGSIEKGDVLVIGNNILAKIRFMEDYLGNRISIATPSMPVRIIGLSDTPSFGSKVKEVDSEREAKNIINIKNTQAKSIGFYHLSEEIKQGKIKILNIILKTDTQGSLEAIKNTLEQLSSDRVKIKIISGAVGPVNENDINLSLAGNALIVSFKVKTNENVKKLANDKKIKIENYDIIYRLIEDVQKLINGLIEPEKVIVIIGKFEALKLFYKTSDKKLVGGKVVDGKMNEGDKVKIYHSGEVVGKGKIESIQIEKNKVITTSKSQECGLLINTHTQIKPGDLVESFKEEIVVPK